MVFKLKISLLKEKPHASVLILNGWPKGPTERYRVYNLKAQLLSEKIQSTVIEEKKIPAVLNKLSAFKLLIIHRAVYSFGLQQLIRACRRYNIPVAFDCDDLIFNPPGTRNSTINYIFAPEKLKLHNTLLKKYQKVFELSDFFITSTDYLKKEGEALKKKSFVLPNCLNMEQMDIAEKLLKKTQISRSEVIIAYFSGSATHQEDFKVCSAALVRLLEEFKEASLLICGYLTLPPEFKKFKRQIIKKPFQPWKKQLSLLYKTDINIIPLVIGDPFCEGKSELKFFEAGLLKVPSVASATTTFRAVIKDGINGMLAQDKEEWYLKLKTLVLNKQKRLQMGERGRKYVLEHYTPESQAPKSLQIIKMISGL